MDGKLFTDDQKHAFLERMNLPIRVFIGLMLSLGTMVLFGATTPSYSVWILEVLVLLTMIVTVLLFSMEIVKEPPLTRLYSVMGFCWVGVLFGMTLIDYLTRGRWPL